MAVYLLQVCIQNKQKNAGRKRPHGRRARRLLLFIPLCNGTSGRHSRHPSYVPAWKGSAGPAPAYPRPYPAGRR